MSNVTIEQDKSLFQKPFLLIGLPLLGLILVIAYLAATEIYSWFRVAAITKRLTAEGVLATSEELQARYENPRSREGTIAWTRAADMANVMYPSSTFEKLPFVGNGPIPYDLSNKNPPSFESEMAAAAGTYLERLQPAIQAIEAAAQFPTPVWQPFVSTDLYLLLPHLQDARDLVRLLALDFEYAVFEAQRERALKDLRLIERVIAAYSDREGVVYSWYEISIRQDLLRAVNSSMSADLWTAENLHEILLRIGPEFYSLSTITNEAKQDAKQMRTNLEKQTAIPLTPSIRFAVLSLFDEDYSQAILNTKNNWPKYYSQKSEDFAKALLQRNVSSGEQIAGIYIRHEIERQLTRTAIGIKKFKLQEVRWPTNLEELKVVGLGPEDWTAVGKYRFGFEVDKDKAYLWGPDTRDELVPPHRPSRNSRADDSSRLVLIR